MREYARRGMRVIGVAVADSSYSVGAKNTLNTLKTIDSICRNNNLRIPMVILSNDSAPRGEINNTATIMIGSLLALLTTPVYEVDKNDRLNWIDPSKVVQNNPGIKLIGIWSPEHPINQKLVYGSDSTDMVDSLLILQNNQDEVLDVPHPPARLKKTGFYDKKMNQFVGRVSSDVSSINAIVDNIEQMQNMEKAQKHSYVDRIATSGSDDIVL